MHYISHVVLDPYVWLDTADIMRVGDVVKESGPKVLQGLREVRVQIELCLDTPQIGSIWNSFRRPVPQVTTYVRM